MTNALVSRFFPSATNMIRLDHMHVLSTFHQYEASAPPRVRRGLVNTLCTALEVHAQLEEEIFYPAVRARAGEELIGKALTEHRNTRHLIDALRAMEPRGMTWRPRTRARRPSGVMPVTIARGMKRSPVRSTTGGSVSASTRQALRSTRMQSISSRCEQTAGSCCRDSASSSLR